MGMGPMIPESTQGLQCGVGKLQAWNSVEQGMENGMVRRSPVQRSQGQRWKEIQVFKK
jgi:hypothetical protein